MPVMPAPGRVAQQTVRLDQVISNPNVPRPLIPMLQALREALQAAKAGCEPGHNRPQQIDGLGGTWIILRFQLEGKMWIGIEWPKQTTDDHGWAIKALRRMAEAVRLTDRNSAACERQLWIYLGP